MSCRVMRRVSGPGSEPQEHSRRDRWSAQSGEPRWTRDGGPSVGRGVHTRQAAVFVALVQHLAVPGLRSRAFLSTATHGHRRKAQVFRPRYAVPKASNSKLNAASRRGQQGATYQQKWRKNTKLATAKLWTVRPLSTAKRGTGSCGGLPRQFVLATTARSRGTLWGDHRSDLQFGRAMVGGDLGRGICTSPGQGAFNRHMVGP